MALDDTGAPRAKSEQSEFDAYAPAYEDLLRDGLRDRFSSGQSEFFHRRKRDLIRNWFALRGLYTRSWSYLDVGCGQGDLLRLLSPEFAFSAGCDTSAGMVRKATSDHIVHQENPLRLPFEDCSFDLVTAVCVYHHVPPNDRAALTREVYRVLKPGATFCVIEHNPLNPMTRLIVARSPVDVDAHLLSHRKTRRLMKECGVELEETAFFMFLPEPFYRRTPKLEDALRWLPLGGQYAVLGRRPPAAPSPGR